MDMSQYLEIFIEESKEHLENLNQCLLQLENSPDDMELINEIFRAAHTLKGMAGTMGFTKMQTLTHDMENVLQALRNSEIKVNSKLVDLLFTCLDMLEGYLNNVIQSSEEGNNDCSELVKNLNNILINKDQSEPQDNKQQTMQEVSEPQPKLEETQNVEDNDEYYVEIDEYSQNAINKAYNIGLSAFKITVELSKGCVLKSARAFLIFQALEKLGDVVKSNPKIEDIEDEKFDFYFTVVLLSKESKESIEKELYKISEVEKITILLVPSKDAVLEEAKTDEKENDRKDTKKNNDQLAEAKVTANKTQVKTGKTVRVDIDRLDNLMNLVSELIIIKTRLEDVKVGANTGTQVYNEAVEYLERITTSLHDAVMKVRMVPIERVFNRFPRLIRDLSKELNKDIELIMTGEETEVDRTVIDEIGDPLIHLLRNSADHGIESHEDREKSGKNKVGNIYLKAYHDGNTVVIEVQDDGAGINVVKIKKKALEKGIVTQDEAENYSQKDWVNLLFKPSFSTADKVTDISGRGVGLDVVKTKIEALEGVIEVETEEGKGSRFVIRLPLTLAIIQALLVNVGSEKYAIPLGSIKQIIDIEPSSIKLIQKKEVILLRNQVIPLIRLDNMLEVEKTEADPNKPLTVVIVKKSDKFAGFIIDELIGQQEIVIKTLGKYLAGISMIAGATILGNGQVALILNVNSLI
jgi:two-component system chemotaxis sensor kinase CheA